MSEQLHPVAVAYREARRAGIRECEAVDAAAAAYLRQHPDADHKTAVQTAIHLVAEAARETPQLLWDGVGSGP